jgi:CheY-like chemotaxis protein/predicted RNase H-like HicB family nuclease
LSAVLLVEDDPDNRRIKADLLRGLAGKGPVVAVEGADEAIRAVRALPGFDLIVADISLPRPGSHDTRDNRDGLSLARWLDRTAYPALLTGYSAVFAEGDIDEGDRALFHAFLGRGESAGQIMEAFEQWLADSVGHRKKLRSDPKALGRTTGAPRPISFAEGVVSVDVVDLVKERAIRELLDEGFKVQLAYPMGNHSRGRPFFVWFRETADDGAFVEVFGQPYLYAHGRTGDEAETALSVLMAKFLEDLAGEDDDKLGQPMIDLRNFLSEVFGG